MWAKWSFALPVTNNYEIFAQWTAFHNRSPAALYTVINNGTQISSATVDQTTNGGQFVSLGTYSLKSGDVEVVLNNTPTGYVIADAIKFVYRGKLWISAITVDNSNPDFTNSGNWGTSSFIQGYYGSNYMYATPDGNDKWAKWTFKIVEPNDYDIRAQWTEFENRSPTASYSIINNGVDMGAVAVDQTQNGGRLNKLGTYYLESGNLEVILNKSAEGCVIADAVQIVPR